MKYLLFFKTLHPVFQYDTGDYEDPEDEDDDGEYEDEEYP